MNTHSPSVFDGQLGATITPGGVQFAVYAAAGGTARLLLFDGPEDRTPSRILQLDPVQHRTGAYWHITVPDVGHGQVYNWCLEGADAKAPVRALIDPYGLATAGWSHYSREAARNSADNTDCALRSVVVDLDRFDWQDDVPPPKPKTREFIYEMHVAGFTAHPSSGVSADLRGTYSAVAERAKHLVALGVTAVELMPVHAYDHQDAPQERKNYWGYSTVSFLAPHPGYAASTTPAAVVDEFREMVRQLHRAGLRVILDVVYNHTAEAGPTGPVLSWRGFADSAYYLQEKDLNRYRDFTGCGNTFNANGPVGSRLIMDSLRHWVSNMHVDGFRFDLAAAMARDEDGTPLERPPVLWAIDTDPVLAGTRLIAEAWDIGGLQLLGNFPGTRFATWNGPFRDTVRRFLKGDGGTIEELMARIVGSPDMFDRKDDRPSGSINLVTCHDGFTLCDLVSYNHKANLANGEENRDGANDNLSWNSGIEGPTTATAVLALRQRRMRNFITLLMFAHGTPMLLSGDEWGQSRQGNNNPWCLANATNWLDWQLATDNADFLRFVREVAHLANSLPVLTDDHFWTATTPEREGDITWHGQRPHQPDWTPSSHCLAYELIPPTGNERVLVLMNAAKTDNDFLPVNPPPGTAWFCVVDTSAQPPRDVVTAQCPAETTGVPLSLAAHTILVLLSRHLTG